MPSASSNRSAYRAAREFAVAWFKVSWQDLLSMGVLGGIAAAVYAAPAVSSRTFPITFAESGDIIFPQWAYPYRGWILPSWLSGLISIALPIVIYLLAQFRIKSAWDASNAIMGTIWAVLLGTLFQVIIKQLIGGFRPYFLDVCMPDISLAPERNATGLNGVGFQQVMYTIEICTQPDAKKLKDAITAFPSGHSTAAFAGFGFLFLWLNAKLKVWADYKPAFWKLVTTMLPLLAAVMIACSLTIDAAHNWYDIVAGSVIGIVMSWAAYRASYAAVFDWRWNHLPLQSRESFAYGAEGDVDYAQQTLTRSVGWGGKRDWLPKDMPSARSSTLFASQTSTQQQQDGIGGGQARARRSPTAEDAV